MIELKNITKVYGSGKNAVTALNNVNITFGDKGLVVILGKSGCGKSSLLNIMGGLDKATDGEMIVNGRSVKTFSGNEFDSYRNTYVGMVFQEFNLIDEITVYQNIEITLKLQNRTADVNTVDEVLSMVGLANLGYRLPTELSGGQRQRVSLARALLKKPQILLADEPTGALDAATGEEVFEALKKLAENRLVVVVTHDSELAFSYGERIIELIDGRVVSDREIQSESYLPVKDLSPNVIEVAAGGKISPQDINDKLKGGARNYVGISYDREKISLAYPETFDYFYRPKEKIKMRDTAAPEPPAQSKSFKLQKSALSIKDSWQMAKVNKKRTRKRFRFITFLNTLCFALLALSFMLSMVNMPDVIAKSAFDTYSQNIVAVSAKTSDYYWQQQETSLTAADISTIKNITGGRNLHNSYKATIVPYYAINSQQNNVASMANYLMSTTNNIDISLESYTGFIECEKISDLGVSLIKNGGSGQLNTANEVIISDFAAAKLLQRGFFGQDKQGRYGSYYLSDATELVGMSVNFLNLGKNFKIGGIFQTDYSRYSYLNKAEERVSSGSKVQIVNWQNNKNFLYSKIFVKTGFAESHFDKETYNIDLNLYGHYGSNISVDLVSLKYDEKYFFNTLNSDEPTFLWVQEEGYKEVDVPGKGTVAFPNLTNNSNIAVSLQFMRLLFPEFNPVNDITTDGGLPRLNERFKSVYIGMPNDSVTVNIAAVYDSSNFEGAVKPFVISSYLYNTVSKAAQINKSHILNSVVFERGNSFNSLKNMAGKLIENDYLMYSSVGSIRDILELGDMFGTAAQVFFYISAAVAAFSFLLILNYMSSSVRFRAKEIAVYRVVGASRWDVAKIFFTESLMLVAYSFVFSCCLGWVLTYFLQLSSKAMLQIFNLSFSIFSFNIITALFVMASVTVLVVTASLLPIFAVTRKNALDALKVIG